jgi:hypothetical protein
VSGEEHLAQALTEANELGDDPYRCARNRAERYAAEASRARRLDEHVQAVLGSREDADGRVRPRPAAAAAAMAGTAG